jgi:hypothetical protein
MKRTFTDKRLSKNISIYKNDFDEYVGVSEGRVLRVYNGVEFYNVAASRTLEGAIQNILNERVSNGILTD